MSSPRQGGGSDDKRPKEEEESYSDLVLPHPRKTLPELLHADARTTTTVIPSSTARPHPRLRHLTTAPSTASLQTRAVSMSSTLAAPLALSAYAPMSCRSFP